MFAVTKLNEVREEETTRKNRVDSILADVFSLLSLFFLTIGKTKECPATYCQIASIRVCYFIAPTAFHLLMELMVATTRPYERICGLQRV